MPVFPRPVPVTYGTPLGLLIADDQQPDMEVSWLTIPSGKEVPADALYHGAAESTLCPSPLDPMAELPNRELFCEHLDDLLRHRIEKDRTTVIVFNIDHLRDINDTHGRQVGDQLLRCVAERLRRRFGDNLAYFNGGVFVAVFDEPRQRREAVHDSPTAVFGQPFAMRAARFQRRLGAPWHVTPRMVRAPRHCCIMPNASWTKSTNITKSRRVRCRALTGDPRCTRLRRFGRGRSHPARVGRRTRVAHRGPLLRYVMTSQATFEE